MLTLGDSKTGRRQVPLSPAAIDALKQLKPGGPDEPVVRITYEAFWAAWNDARERAGINDLHLHDLRRAAATRMALKTGNVFLVQALTGRKTLEMAQRYMSVTADDAVSVGCFGQPARPMVRCTQHDGAIWLNWQLSYRAMRKQRHEAPAERPTLHSPLTK